MTEEVRWILLKGVAVHFDIKGQESILEKARIYFGEPLVEKWGERMLGYVKDLRFKNSIEFKTQMKYFTDMKDAAEDRLLENGEGNQASYSFLRKKIDKLENVIENMKSESILIKDQTKLVLDNLEFRCKENEQKLKEQRSLFEEGLASLRDEIQTNLDQIDPYEYFLVKEADPRNAKKRVFKWIREPKELIAERSVFNPQD